MEGQAPTLQSLGVNGLDAGAAVSHCPIAPLTGDQRASPQTVPSEATWAFSPGRAGTSGAPRPSYSPVSASISFPRKVTGSGGTSSRTV